MYVWSGCGGEQLFEVSVSNEIKGLGAVCKKARAFGRVLQGGRKSLYVMSVMYFFEYFLYTSERHQLTPVRS